MRLTFLLEKKSKQKKTLKNIFYDLFLKVFEDSKETFFKKFLWWVQGKALQKNHLIKKYKSTRKPRAMR